MDETQEFCLQWNDHQPTLIKNFEELLVTGFLSDCTLAVEGNYIKAHKIVLSSCSLYFEKLLKEHQDKYPVFILSNITFEQLKSILEYIYKGKVTVCQNQVDSFIKIIDFFQIKRVLSENESEETTSNLKTKLDSKIENNSILKDSKLIHKKSNKQNSKSISKFRESKTNSFPKDKNNTENNSPSILKKLLLEMNPKPFKTLKEQKITNKPKTITQHEISDSEDEIINPKIEHMDIQDETYYESHDNSTNDNCLNDPLNTSEINLRNIIDRTKTENYKIIPGTSNTDISMFGTEELDDFDYVPKKSLEMNLFTSLHGDKINFQALNTKNNSKDLLDKEDDIINTLKDCSNLKNENPENSFIIPQTPLITNSLYIENAQQWISQQLNYQYNLIQSNSQNKTNDRLHKCDNCGRSYKHKKHLTRHIRDECGEKSSSKMHMCNSCGKSYKYKRGLTKHVHEVCGDSNLLQCPYCPKRFDNKEIMIRHSLKHVNDKFSEFIN